MNSQSAYTKLKTLGIGEISHQTNNTCVLKKVFFFFNVRKKRILKPRKENLIIAAEVLSFP